MSSGVFRKMAVTNIRSNRRFYVPFLLTVLLVTAMFYNMCSVSRNPAFLENGTMEMILEFGVVLLAIFSGIFVFYTNSFLMKRRKRELGLYHILGLEKRHITKILVHETLMMGVAGIFGGLLAGLLLDRLMFLIILKIYHYPVTVSHHISWFAVRTTLILFAAVFLLLLVSNVASIRKSSAIELLRSEHAGEREPKTKWITAIIGFLLVGSGYYIAITTDNILDALTLLFVAVFLVMIGTYFLFLAGSIAVLKLLRKRKNYYYRTNHFVAVSGMIYRMKRNAVGLANICILSTGVLLVISTTVCLYAGMKEIMQQRYLSDIAAFYGDRTAQESAALEELVRTTAREQGVTLENERSYESISIAFLAKDGELSTDQEKTGGAVLTMDDVMSVTVISAQTYERMTGETLALNENEVAVHHVRDTFDESFLMLGAQYTVAKELDSFPIANKMENQINNWMSLVVSSDEKLYEIDRAQKAAFELPSQLGYQLLFDVDGSDEETIAFYRLLEKRIAEKSLAKPYLECRLLQIDQAYELYGSTLFLGIYLGALFLMATVLIIYYKQIIEGYEDRDRYVIMKKVGMDEREVRRSIRSQILIMFFLPLCTALLHCLAAFQLMTQILKAFYMTDAVLFAGVTAAVAGVFALGYVLIFAVTARRYYHIVNE